MQYLNYPDPLVVIVGPTAVGKTELSIQIAERLGAEVVSADSRLFYRGMNIGTAKPSPTDMARVPHHLIDVANPDETWSLAQYQREAAGAIKEIHGRNRLPILIGGTGQYIHAVVQGWDIPPQVPDQAMRHALERWNEEIGPFELYQRLAVVDPEAARIIDPRNVRRTIRALEVVFRTGERFSSLRKQSGSPYSLLMIGLRRPRAELFKRVDLRIEQMLADGLVEEVNRLMMAGYSRDLPSMSAIGYREIQAVIRGEMTLDEAVTLIKRLTRKFVRRQANWFRENDPLIHWFDVNEGAFKNILAYIQNSENWTRTPNRSSI